MQHFPQDIGENMLPVQLLDDRYQDALAEAASVGGFDSTGL
jgi:hypothetical protein